jgi:hypothetical protein
MKHLQLPHLPGDDRQVGDQGHERRHDNLAGLDRRPMPSVHLPSNIACIDAGRLKLTGVCGGTTVHGTHGCKRAAAAVLHGFADM